MDHVLIEKHVARILGMLGGGTGVIVDGEGPLRVVQVEIPRGEGEIRWEMVEEV